MRDAVRNALTSAAILGALSACEGPSSALSPLGQWPEAIQDAAAIAPTGRALVREVLAPTCGTAGCHDGTQPPRLLSESDLAPMLGAPCGTSGPPSSMPNFCEVAPDEVEFSGSGAPARFRSPLGRIAEVNNGGGDTDLAFELLDPAPDWVDAAALYDVRIHGSPLVPSTGPVASIDARARLAPGSRAGRITDLGGLPEATRAALRSGLVIGDPNEDGTFGGFQPDHGLQVVPGAPIRSYLYRRTLAFGGYGPMPPQAPLDTAAQAALECWIRTVRPADPAGTIDYGRCVQLRDAEGG